MLFLGIAPIELLISEVIGRALGRARIDVNTGTLFESSDDGRRDRLDLAVPMIERQVRLVGGGGMEIQIPVRVVKSTAHPAQRILKQVLELSKLADLGRRR